ncbi:MAG: hypothetical protein H0T60_09095 [Acidobacteria bacterium]|nr:hypothetical protein [Acidobacteriota bacterium]
MPDTLEQVEARFVAAQQEERVRKLELVKSLADALLNLPVNSIEFGDKALELRDVIDDCD